MFSVIFIGPARARKQQIPRTRGHVKSKCHARVSRTRFSTRTEDYHDLSRDNYLIEMYHVTFFDQLQCDRKIIGELQLKLN